MIRHSNTVLRIALTIIVACSVSAVSAAELSLPDLVQTDCNSVCLPVTVQDFSGVAGVELHFTYDDACMTFDTVLLGYLGGATVNGGGGAVHIIWEDFLNPLTLASDEELTRICFTNISPSGPCAIGFQSSCELVDEFGDPISLATTDGSAGCGGCCALRGDVNHDGGELIDIADLLYLIDYMFNSGAEPICFEEADIDASGGELLDISDLLYLIDFMFRGGAAPTSCQ